MLAKMRERFPDTTFIAANDEESLARESVDSDVFFGFHFPEELVAGARRLRWIQSAGAGIERNLSPAIRASEIALTNASGLAAVPIAEHVLALILTFCRNLHVAYRLQETARWDRPSVMVGAGAPLRELRGSRVGICGLGPIGIAVAERAAALGAVVRGVRRRTPSSVSPPFEAVVGPSDLDTVLGWSDFVVLAVPQTAQTDQMIGRRELAAMRSDAYLINIARGSVVDEGALIDALQRGAIAGAGLDVFADEPLPDTSALWKLPNVVVTPHVAGAMPRYFDRALDLFVDNFERLRSGLPLHNLVDKDAGYPIHNA